MEVNSLLPHGLGPCQEPGRRPFYFLPKGNAVLHLELSRYPLHPTPGVGPSPSVVHELGTALYDEKKAELHQSVRLPKGLPAGKYFIVIAEATFIHTNAFTVQMRL